MIDVVILGGGHMGTLHARVFGTASPENARVVGVFDIDPTRSTFATLAEALDAADLTVVATPIDTHRALAQAALFAGSAVLVEKPVCGSTEDAQALDRAQRRSGRPVFVGHSERFNPVVVALRTRVDGRRVRQVTLERLAVDTRAAAHGVAVNLAVHDVDLARTFLGGTMLVRSASGDLEGGTGSATIHASQRALLRQRKITVDVDEDRYEGDLLGGTLRGPDGAIQIGTAEPLMLQARGILSELGGEGESGCATLADGIAALEIALNADSVRSAQTRPLAR
jgi:predicted dehydrogenase